MPRRAVFVPNPRGAEEVMASQRVLSRLEARAEAIAARARQRAPVGETGNYRASIHVQRDDTHERPRFKVVASDYKANWIEWGTDVMRPRRVLGRAAYLKPTKR